MQIVALASLLSLGATTGHDWDPATRELLTRGMPMGWEFKATVISFFQIDCQPCRAVWKELRCLTEAGWSVVAIGLGDDHLRLRQEWLHQGKPGVLLTKSFRDAQTKLEVNGTPTVWWRQHAKDPWSKRSGSGVNCREILTPPPSETQRPVP